MSLKDCIHILKPHLSEADYNALESSKNPYSWAKSRLTELNVQRGDTIELIVDETVKNALAGNQEAMERVKSNRLYGPKKKPDYVEFKAGDAAGDAVERELTENAISVWESAVRFFKRDKAGWAKQKVDTSKWDRLLSMPTHYFRKVRGLLGVLNAASDKTTEQNNLINEIQQTPDGENLLVRGHKLKSSSLKELERSGLKGRKKRKAEYARVKDYVIHNDRNQIGPRVEHKDGDHVLYDPKGKEVKRFLSEDRAWAESRRREHKDLIEKGFSQQAADVVVGFRIITYNGFEVLISDLRKIEAVYREAGRPLPIVDTFMDGEVRQVNLREAVAHMGDRRGYYMPRIYKSGRFVAKATKKGTNPIRKHFDSKVVMKGWQVLKERQGYTVEKFKDTSLGEDVWELAGSIIKTQAVINKALDDAHEAMKKGGNFASQFDEITANIEEEFAKAIAQQVADIHKGRGFRGFMMRRSEAKGKDVTIGYEEDPVIALGLYTRSLAAGEAKKNMALKMLKAFTGTEESWSEYEARLEDQGEEATRKGYVEQVREQRVDPAEQKEAFEDGLNFMEDLLRNDDFVDRVLGTIKGVSVLKYLAGRVPAVFVNLTAMLTSAMATISYYSGQSYEKKGKTKYKGGVSLNKAARLIGNTSKDYEAYKWSKVGDRSKLDKWTVKMFKELEDNGWHKAQLNREALSTIKTKLGRGWDNAIDILMIGFSVSEMYNRVATIGAAYQAIRTKHPAGWDNWTEADHDAAMNFRRFMCLRHFPTTTLTPCTTWVSANRVRGWRFPRLSWRG
jgi:hypothetical protein